MNGHRRLTPDQRRARTAEVGQHLRPGRGELAGDWLLAGRPVRPGAALSLQLVTATAYLCGHQQAHAVPTEVRWLAVRVTTVQAADVGLLPGSQRTRGVSLCPLPGGRLLALTLRVRGADGPLPLVATRRMHLAWPGPHTASSRPVELDGRGDAPLSSRATARRALLERSP